MKKSSKVEVTVKEGTIRDQIRPQPIASQKRYILKLVLEGDKRGGILHMFGEAVPSRYRGQTRRIGCSPKRAGDQRIIGGDSG